MFVSKTTRYLFCTALCLGLSLGADAQEKVEFKDAPQVKLNNYCRGEVKVLSQQQTGSNVDLEVQISIADCDGPCTGTLEYAMVFTDASKNEIMWQLTDGWDWRSVQAPFTLKLHQKALPDTQLKEIKSMKIGRCTCSTIARK